MSLLGFGVKNLRCLTDTGIVPIKPITLLVGRNSSGKSTLLRAFPLLRQTVENARSAPILWYDPRFVDFGSFADAVNYRAAKTIGLMFRAECQYPVVPGASFYSTDTFDVEATLCDGPRGSYVESYSVTYENYDAKIRFGSDGSMIECTIDSFDTMPTAATLSLGGRALLLPSPELPDGERLSYRSFNPAHDDQLWDDEMSNGGEAFKRDIHTAWEALFGEKRAPAKLEIPIAPYAQAIEMMTRWPGNTEAKKAVLASLEAADHKLRHLMAFRIAALVPTLIDAMSLAAAQFFAGVRYVAPFRASADRVHRIVELSVDEIDPRGDNLAMFLRSLSPEEMQSLASFTRAHLGFETAIRSERNNVEIVVKERGADRFVNLVDAGFGFAEILPLAATLWSAAARTPRPGDRPATMLAFEQPELHLHPARQATLPRMLVGALDESRKAGHEVKLMVETHSDAVVNQLGMLIRAGKVAQEDVQILFFDLKDPATRETKVVVTGYERDGALQESWPFGFLVGVPDPLDDLSGAAAEE